jgi:hypothetical protein
MNTIPDDTIITGDSLFDFIHENFRRITGILSCENPHWWIHFYVDHLDMEYWCCDSPDCSASYYEIYEDQEELMVELKDLQDEYWTWKNN